MGVTQLLLWNSGFITEVSEGFIKKWSALPVKTVHRKQLHPGEHFYFQELQLQKSVKVSDVNKLVFLQKSARIFFSINYCSRIFDLCPSTHFSFHEKLMKAKRMKTEHASTDKVFKYDLTKFQKYWSNKVVVGAHGRLNSQSPAKFLTTKHTPMLPLNYSGCLLCNMLIQQRCLTSCISFVTF